MSALRLSGVAVRFGDAPGLAGVSLAVEPGERLVVVGASGAGKTTLLRAVAGFAPVVEGRVEIGGRDVTRLPPERRDAVYLHQTPVLFPHLDVGENVAFPLRVRGVREPEVAQRVERALEAVRLGELARRRPGSLSGGQRHRVALARAMVARPAVLLLDEPFAALDPALREEVRAATLELQREYRPALVLVTHDLDEAGLLGDWVGVLLERRLAQLAPPAELFGRPASLAVSRFLGITNEVPGQVEPDGSFRCALGGWPPALPVPPGPAVAVLPAGALRIGAAGGVAARVVELRPRPHRTTARVEVAGLRLEVEVDPARPPEPGAAVPLEVEAALVRVFASDSGLSGPGATAAS